MTPTVFEIAGTFFGNIEKSAKGQQELKRCDRKIEFAITDDQPFSVQVKNGIVSLQRGINKSPGRDVCRITIGRDELLAMFGGRIQFTDFYLKQRDGISGSQALVGRVGILIRMGQELR